MGNNEVTGDRIAIMSQVSNGEIDLGGYCYEAAKKAVEDELRTWLQSLDNPTNNKQEKR
jgi:hypothetical protein